MSEIGAGTGSSYPTSLDTNSTIEVNSPAGGKTKARAEVPNDLAAAIVNIETELGTDPAGTKTDVKTFLQVEHQTDGTHSVISVVTKTDDYVILSTDSSKTIIANKATAIAFTLVAAASGRNNYFKNIGAGTLTLTGTVILNGTSTVNPTMAQHDEMRIWTDGTTWYGVRYSATPAASTVPVRDASGNIGGGPGLIGEISATGTTITTTLDLGTVTAGDRIDVTAQVIIASGLTLPGQNRWLLMKSSGTATMKFLNNQTWLGGTLYVSNQALGEILVRGVLQVTGSGTLVIKNDGILVMGSPVYTANDIYAFFLKKQ